MDALLYQGWSEIQTALYRMRYEENGRIVFVVVLLAVMILLWLFLSPSVKRKKG